MIRVLAALALALGLTACGGPRAKAADAGAQIVTYSAPGSPRLLRGLIYKPPGPGPFPTVLFNHGSAPGLLNNQAFDALGPMFVAHGWAFFAPYRRGQGLSQEAGPYILDAISAARARGGPSAATDTLVDLLSTDHLDDQKAAFAWLRSQPFVQADRIAVMGNSFGGVETLLGAGQLRYCAAVDASGGAESWSRAPALREAMLSAVGRIQIPVMFFQARNDYDTAPSVSLHAAMIAAGKPAKLVLYPAYGSSEREGHSFAYRGAATWEPDVLAFLTSACPPKAP